MRCPGRNSILIQGIFDCQILNVQVPFFFKQIVDAMNVEITASSTVWLLAGSAIAGCKEKPPSATWVIRLTIALPAQTEPLESARPSSRNFEAPSLRQSLNERSVKLHEIPFPTSCPWTWDSI